MKNEINDQHKIFPLPNYEKIDDLLSNERNNGLTHIITDKSQNPKSQRNEFLVEIFENEYEYEFLKKIYDSKKDGFRYHLKIFEIDYEIFDQHKKTNEKILN